MEFPDQKPVKQTTGAANCLTYFKTPYMVYPRSFMPIHLHKLRSVDNKPDALKRQAPTGDLQPE